MKPKFYYSELDNYNEEHLKRIILYLKEVIECTDPLLKKIEEDSAVDTALKCYKRELEEKINKLKEFRIVENIDYGLEEGFGRITYIDVVKKDELLKLLEE